mgnify:CR=1 FL=1
MGVTRGLLGQKNARMGVVLVGVPAGAPGTCRLMPRWVFPYDRDPVLTEDLSNKAS